MSDKTSDKRLLPCPFCGGKAVLDREDIFCDNCFLSMKIDSRLTNGEAETYEEAREQVIEAWNTRKPMEKIAERLEEYRDEFMDDIYEELREDADNCRANRIIERFDSAIEIVKEGLK